MQDNCPYGSELSEITCFRHLVETLRNLQADANNLRALFLKFPEANQANENQMLLQKDVSPLAKQNIINELNDRCLDILKSVTDIEEYRRSLYQMKTCLAHYQLSDQIVHVINSWDSIILLLAKFMPKEDEACKFTDDAVTLFLDEANKVNRYFNRLFYHIGEITIPNRINASLRRKRVGEILDFNTFEDELPDEICRHRFLEWLHNSPKKIKGVIDVDNHLIYSTDLSKGETIKTIVYISLPLILGACVSYYLLPNLGLLMNLQGMPITKVQSINLLAVYLFILLGGFIHIVVYMMKESKTDKGKKFPVIEDFFLWIHVKRTSIVGGILLLMVGFFGLIYLTPVTAQTWTIAFFVGYSIDSFIDIFLQRFEGAIPTTESLVKKIT